MSDPRWLSKIRKDVAKLEQQWLSAAEIAEHQFYGLRSKRKVLALARKEGWASRSAESGQPLVRRRIGGGGCLEFHITALSLSLPRDIGERKGKAPKARKLSLVKQAMAERLQSERDRLGLTESAIRDRFKLKRRVFLSDGIPMFTESLTIYAAVGMDVAFIVTGRRAEFASIKVAISTLEPAERRQLLIDLIAGEPLA